LAFFSSPAFPQKYTDGMLSGDFLGMSLQEFADKVEAVTPYHFYFDPADFDSLTVDIRVREQAITAVLNQLFYGSDVQFAIDQHQHIFLTRGKEIRTQLPLAFFDRSDYSDEDFDVAMFDYLDAGDTKKMKATDESKLFEIGVKTTNVKTGSANLAGHIIDAQSGEPVIGAVVYIENPWTGVATDHFGYYALTLPRGRHELKIKSIGMKDTRRQVMLYTDGKLDIELYEDVIPLKEVVIESEKDVNVSGLQMGLEKLDISTMKQVPAVLGETDVLKVALTLPGVQSVGESSTGLNVRGGATDQNLILFNDAVIYNPSHLFGFFSAFNPDVLKNVELYKSGIPAEYGGRLSSVLEVNTREGNKRKFAGAGGIGLVTGRLSLEGPIVKDKTSFLVAGRSTYSDWLLNQIDDPAIRNSTAAFYDLNAHISHEFNDKNSLYLTGYMSNDRFRLNSDTLYSYQNQSLTMKWKHIFKNKLYGVFTGGISRYTYDVSSEANATNAYTLHYDLKQSNLKADFNWFPSARHKVDFGVSTIFYKLHPGSFQPLGAESLIVPEDIQAEQALESAVYIGDRYDITPKLSLYAGLRFSLYQYLGPKSVFTYPDDVPKSVSNIRDTLQYGSGKVINTYGGPEYRLSARYALASDASVKLSFNRMRQYIHMLSNTTSIAPTDIWKLSDPNILPQVGDQVSLGLYKNLKSNTIETSVEAYYKWLDDFLDFRSGADLILNSHIETDVVNARGKAYGIELMVKKLTGKLNGWMSYTYSRSFVQVDDPATSEIINEGKWYPSNFDKPHDFTFIGNYKFSRRFSFSLNFTYSTGRPITFPLAKYELGGSKRLHYSNRNEFRIPDYYRMDFSVNLEGNHKVRKLSHSSWTLAVYNLLGRQNVYSIYFVSENGEVNGYKLSIFGQAIPTLTYNFKF
jgi:hypothetical protein